MNKKSNKLMFRQGDVIMIQTNVKPNLEKEIARDNGRIILAYGEVTGHAHAISNQNVKMYHPSDEAALAAGSRILQVLQPAALVHDEHATIELPAGTYEVRIQREYTPQGIRNVAD